MLKFLYSKLFFLPLAGLVVAGRLALLMLLLLLCVLPSVLCPVPVLLSGWVAWLENP